MCTKFDNNGSVLFAIALVVILQSTLSSVTGLQFDRSSTEQSSLGIKVITPLHCEIESSFARRLH